MEMIEKIIHAEQMLFYQNTIVIARHADKQTSLSTLGKWLHCGVL